MVGNDLDHGVKMNIENMHYLFWGGLFGKMGEIP